MDTAPLGGTDLLCPYLKCAPQRAPPVAMEQARHSSLIVMGHASQVITARVVLHQARVMVLALLVSSVSLAVPVAKYVPLENTSKV